MMAREEKYEPTQLSPEHTKIISNAIASQPPASRHLSSEMPLIFMTNDGGGDGRPVTPLDDIPTAVNSRRQSFCKDAEKQSMHDSIDIYDPNRLKIGFYDRMHHFTWAWFTLPMSTGGLSLCEHLPLIFLCIPTVMCTKTSEKPVVY